MRRFAEQNQSRKGSAETSHEFCNSNKEQQHNMKKKKTAAGMEEQNLGKTSMKERKKIAVAVVEEQNLGEGQQEMSYSPTETEKNSTEKKIAAAVVEEPNLENSEQTNSSGHQSIREEIVQETHSLVSYEFTETYVGATPVFDYRPLNERMTRCANFLQQYGELLQDSLRRNANQQGHGRGTQPRDGHN